MKIVLAGDAREFEQWRMERDLYRRDCCYVLNAETLAGKQVGRGDVVELVGFKSRRDAAAIEAALMAAIHRTEAVEATKGEAEMDDSVEGAQP